MIDVVVGVVECDEATKRERERVKKWQSLLFCDEEKGAKYFSILIFSRKREETER